MAVEVTLRARHKLGAPVRSVGPDPFGRLSIARDECKCAVCGETWVAMLVVVDSPEEIERHFADTWQSFLKRSGCYPDPRVRWLMTRAWRLRIWLDRLFRRIPRGARA